MRSLASFLWHNQTSKQETPKRCVLWIRDVDTHVDQMYMYIYIYMSVTVWSQYHICMIRYSLGSSPVRAFDHGTIWIYVLRAFLVSRDAVAPTKCNGAKGDIETVSHEMSSRFNLLHVKLTHEIFKQVCWMFILLSDISCLCYFTARAAVEP